MAEQLTLSGLVDQMKGRSTLNGWDVLVAYDEQQVNKLLQLRSALFTSLINVPTIKTTVEDNRTGEDLEMITDIKLGSPLLQFTDAKSGSIQLVFGLTGQFSIDGKVTVIPDGFKLLVGTTLTNATGSYNSSNDFVAAEGASNKKSANQIVIMEPGRQTAQGVCIDLSADKLGIDFSFPPQTEEKKKKHYTWVFKSLSSELTSHFTKNGGLKYCLAGISNAYDAGVGSQVLRPKSFCFTVVAGDSGKGTSSTLCMYIGVEGGANNGVRPTGGTSITFHPGDSDLHPLPKGSTATVIFSHDLMGNYFKNALESKGSYKNAKITSVVGTPGMVIKATCKGSSYKDMSNVKHWGSGLSFNKYTAYSDISLDMSQTDTSFSFGTSSFFGLSSNPLQISYTSQEIKCTFTEFVVPAGMPSISDTVFTFSHGGSATWEDDRLPGSKTPNLLRLKFSMPSKFDVSSVSSDRLLFWKVDRKDPPDEYKNVELSIPSFNWNLTALDYFLTTNLLIPGAHMFIADPPAYNASSGKGLCMPRDTILTGSIAKELKAV